MVNDPATAAPSLSSSATPRRARTRASVLDLHHDTPAVVFVNTSISTALDVGASDIHFTPQQRRLFVRIRVDGVMRELTSIPGTQATAVVSRLKIMGGLDIAERRMPQDGRVSVKRGDESIDVRMATLPTTYGEKVTLRMLAQGEAPESLDALGMSPRSHAALERAISQPFGAVVVVGPTGSGKTTTLFTCLQLLNTPDRQLTTIEDPVEYRVDGLDQVEVNPRAGLTFANGLRTILRSDPDVLLVGEIRDEETAQIAFRASMTGHLILTTLARPDGGFGDPAPDGHEDRAKHPRDVDQLHRRPATRAPRVPGLLRADGAGARAAPDAERVLDAQRAGLRSAGRLPRMRWHRLPRPRSALRGDDDDRRDRAARQRADARDRGDGGLAGHGDAARRTACASRRPGSRRSRKSAGSPARPSAYEASTPRLHRASTLAADVRRRAHRPSHDRRLPSPQRAGARLRAGRPRRLRLAAHPLVRLAGGRRGWSRLRCSTASRPSRC